jgi:hypothetical protein
VQTSTPSDDSRDALHGAHMSYRLYHSIIFLVEGIQPSLVLLILPANVGEKATLVARPFVPGHLLSRDIVGAGQVAAGCICDC